MAFVDRVLARIEAVGMVVLTLTALAIGVMQVVLRYVFNTGFPWSEGVFVTLTIWAMLLAGSRAVRDGVHVRVDVFVRYLPAGPRRAAELVALVAPLALCGMFFYSGFLYTRFVFDMGIVSPESYLPEWLVYGSVPVCMAAFVLRYLILIAGWFRGASAPPEHPGELS